MVNIPTRCMQSIGFAWVEQTAKDP